MRRTIPLILATLLLGTVFAVTAGAHVFSAETRTGIQRLPKGPVDPGTKVLIFGRLKSADGDCVANQQVRLILSEPGPDEELKVDTTDDEGEYGFVRRPHRDQRVYVLFDGSLETSYGHSHGCQASKSVELPINVKGI